MQGWDSRISRLVDKVGRDITHRTYVSSGPAFNPVLTQLDVTLRSAVFDFEADEIDGSIIQRHDKQFVISIGPIDEWYLYFLSMPISTQDKIVDGGIEYSIVSVNDTAPGDTQLLYIIQGRA